VADPRRFERERRAEELSSELETDRALINLHWRQTRQNLRQASTARERAEKRMGELDSQLADLHVKRALAGDATYWGIALGVALGLSSASLILGVTLGLSYTVAISVAAAILAFGATALAFSAELRSTAAAAKTEVLEARAKELEAALLPERARWAESDVKLFWPQEKRHELSDLEFDQGEDVVVDEDESERDEPEH
jgi:hypothetical protein